MTQAPERYMGNGIPRKEDPNLVTGKANWTDNIKLPGMVHMSMLRSPFARARVTKLDVSAALDTYVSDIPRPFVGRPRCPR